MNRVSRSIVNEDDRPSYRDADRCFEALGSACLSWQLGASHQIDE